jgi:DNA polymerase III subunit beta
MECRIEKDEFVKGLYRAQSVVEKKVTMPILSNVLIEAQGSGVSFTATDMEIGIKGTHPAEIVKEGRATVSAKKLYEVVKELPEKTVGLRLKENNWVEVACGKSNFKIMALPAENFPSLPVQEEGDFFSIEVATLREMIAKTIFAVSTDESRYNLTGVYFTRREGEEGNVLRMVATDGYRLSLIDRALKAPLTGIDDGILLPKKGLAELNKLLDEAGETLSFKLKENNFIVRKDNVLLIMRLLDAEFPDYRQVIPAQSKRKIRMQRRQTEESLHRVSLLSSEKTRGVKFHFSNGSLEFSAYNPDLGEAKEEIPIDYKAEEITVGFNSRFVLDALGVLDSEDIVLELEDGVSPAVLRPENDPQHTCVIMPMRV